MRNHAAVLAILACGAPGLAHASNFSVLLYFLYGVSALLALLLAIVAYHSARGVQSRLARGVIWGSWAALVLSPLSVQGGNGTLSGTPILAFTSLMFGSDPAYAVAALKILLVSIPVCSVALWQIQRMWAAAADKDKPAGGDG